MSKACPVCGLLSPAAAGRCDCGYDFATRRGGHRETVFGIVRRRVVGDPGILYVVAAILAAVSATVWRGPFAGWRETLEVAIPWILGGLLCGAGLGRWIRSASTRTGTVARSAFVMSVLSVVAAWATSTHRWWRTLAADYRQLPVDFVAVAGAAARECLTAKFAVLVWLAAVLGAIVGAILARQSIAARHPRLLRVAAVGAIAVTGIGLMAADFAYQGPYLRHFIDVRFAQAKVLAGQPEANVPTVMGPPTWTDRHWDQVMSGTLQPAPGAKFLTLYHYAPYPIRESHLRWLESSDRIVIACADGRVLSVACSVRLRFDAGRPFPPCALGR